MTSPMSHASHKLMQDWEKYIGDGWEKASHASLNPTEGNLCCFIFPESKPERLGVLTYLTDLWLFHDGSFWIFLVFRGLLVSDSWF